MCEDEQADRSGSRLDTLRQLHHFVNHVAWTRLPDVDEQMLVPDSQISSEPLSRLCIKGEPINVHATGNHRDRRAQPPLSEKLQPEPAGQNDDFIGPAAAHAFDAGKQSMPHAAASPMRAVDVFLRELRVCVVQKRTHRKTCGNHADSCRHARPRVNDAGAMPDDRRKRGCEAGHAVEQRTGDAPIVVHHRMPADSRAQESLALGLAFRAGHRVRRPFERHKARPIAPVRKPHEIREALRLTERLPQRPVRDVQACRILQTTLSRSVGIDGTGSSGRSGRVLPNSVSASASVRARTTLAGDPAASVNALSRELDTTEPRPTIEQSAMRTPGAMRTSDPM